MSDHGPPHWMQSVREAALPPLDDAARSLPTERVPGVGRTLYAAYTLGGRSPDTRGEPAEHAVTYDGPPAEAARVLRRAGYGFGQLAALKYHPDDGRSDDGNLIKRPSRWAMWQTHAHLFATDDGRTEIHGHYERNGLRAPVRHYGADGYNIERGRDLVVEDVASVAPAATWELSEWSGGGVETEE